MEPPVAIIRELSQIIHPFILYLTIVNILTFGIFAIDCKAVGFSHNGNTGYFHGSILMPFAVVGGAFGMVSALTVFARRYINKHNVAWWFCGIICFILWTIIILIWSGIIVVNFNSFHVPNMTILIAIGIYLAFINLLTFALFCFDKAKSYEHGLRLREFTLLGLGLLGGSMGGILAMRLVRHKTKKWYFTIGFRVFIVLQIGLLVIAYGAGIL